MLKPRPRRTRQKILHRRMHRVHPVRQSDAVRRDLHGQQPARARLHRARKFRRRGLHLSVGLLYRPCQIQAQSQHRREMRRLHALRFLMPDERHLRRKRPPSCSSTRKNASAAACAWTNAPFTRSPCGAGSDTPTAGKANGRELRFDGGRYL